MASLGSAVGAIMGWIGYHLGQRTDVADAAGSLHGKVKDVKDGMDAKLGTSADSRADNTVYGWLKTGVKSWQRVTGTTSGNNALILALTSVDPAKCHVMVDGCQWVYGSVTGKAGMVPLMRYVSAFSATSITLAVSQATVMSGESSNYIDGTFSVIVVEHY